MESTADNPSILQCVMLIMPCRGIFLVQSGRDFVCSSRTSSPESVARAKVTLTSIPHSVLRCSSLFVVGRSTSVRLAKADKSDTYARGCQQSSVRSFSSPRPTHILFHRPKCGCSTFPQKFSRPSCPYSTSLPPWPASGYARVSAFACLLPGGCPIVLTL